MAYTHKVIGMIQLSAAALCLLTTGCDQQNDVLAVTEDETPTPRVEQQQPAAATFAELDALDQELASLHARLVEPESAEPAAQAQSVMPGNEAEVSEDVFDSDMGPGLEWDEDLSEVSKWLMDPTILDDPDSKFFLVVAREIAAIRGDMERMRQTMDAQYGGYIDELQRENMRLRQEVRRAYVARNTSGGAGMPMLPLDDAPFAGTEDVWASGAPQGFTHQTPEQAMASAPEEPLTEKDIVTAIVASGDGQYAVIKEWGRTPAEAQAYGSDTPSLRGMIAVVPPNTTSEELIALGQSLHQEGAQYDNVSIMIFASQEAANTYAESNSMKDGMPVLRLSKYSETGEDAIYLNQGGAEVEVPAQ